MTMKYIDTNLLITLTTLAMINIVVRMAMAIRATVPESFSAGCGDDCSVFDWLFPNTLTSTENERGEKINNRLIYFLFKIVFGGSLTIRSFLTVFNACLSIAEKFQSGGTCT